MAATDVRFSLEEGSEVLRRFGSNAEKGLAPIDVEERRLWYGKNALSPVRGPGMAGRVFAQVISPLSLVLVIAGVVTLVLGEYIDAAVITAALIVNVGIGVFQEERAGKAFERLNASRERFAHVIREGRPKLISASELVVGDIVELSAGAYVPADIRLLSTKELSVNESALTGEWMAVGKHHEVLPTPVALAEERNMAWMGTLVSSGYARGVVVEVGDETELGRIARTLAAVPSAKTPLTESIGALSRFIIYLVLTALSVIFLVGIIRGQPLIEMFLLSVSVAVAAMPEGLPAVVTVVLALGMEAILRRGGLVRNLLAAETLGVTTVILTDKTGTLTEASMRVSDLWTFASLASEKHASADEHVLLRTAMLASDAFVEVSDEQSSVVRGRPMEQAILRRGLESGISTAELSESFPRRDYLQFESARRFGASLNEHEGARSIALSGEPELLLSKSAYVYYHGGRKRLTAEIRAHFEEALEKGAGEGMRVVGVAAAVSERSVLCEAECGDLLSRLTFIGLIAFSDPVRLDAAAAVREVEEAGVRVIMVTGDNAGTARKVAEEVGIARGDAAVYTGADIEAADDEALGKMLSEGRIFARTLPEQKLRLARILRERGEVVAMTGDGINDAPALQHASIGIALGSGTEVAKEASDIILTTNSFSVIVAAIEEGRRILENLRKITAYLLATSSSEIILIGGSLIAGTPLPLLPTQILWANMVEEGFMSFMFAFEPAERGLMRRRPQRKGARKILTPDLKRMILIVSSVTGALLIGLYGVLVALELPEDELRSIMFVALSLDAIFFSFSLKSLTRPLWRIDLFSNRFLLLALSISVGTLLLAFVPPFNYFLSLTPLSRLEVLILTAIGLANLATIETVKYFVFRRRR